MGLKIMKMYHPLSLLFFFFSHKDLWEKFPLLTFVKSVCGVMWHLYIILYIFCNVLIAKFIILGTSVPHSLFFFFFFGLSIWELGGRE